MRKKYLRMFRQSPDKSSRQISTVAFEGSIGLVNMLNAALVVKVSKPLLSFTDRVLPLDYKEDFLHWATPLFPDIKILQTTLRSLWVRVERFIAAVSHCKHYMVMEKLLFYRESSRLLRRMFWISVLFMRETTHSLLTLGLYKDDPMRKSLLAVKFY